MFLPATVELVLVVGLASRRSLQESQASRLTHLSATTAQNHIFFDAQAQQ
jgi:hypothetical protein